MKELKDLKVSNFLPKAEQPPPPPEKVSKKKKKKSKIVLKLQKKNLILEE